MRQIGHAPDAALVPARSVWRINLILAALGAAGGAVTAIPLTWLGKVIAGAPPASFANYRWNMIAFGLLGAYVAPGVVWGTMRRVPLVRAVMEPALGGLAGVLIGMLLGSPIALLGLGVAGVVGAVWRLGRAYPEMAVLPDPVEEVAQILAEPTTPLS